MSIEQLWEKSVLLELNFEYRSICALKKIQLKPVLIRLFDSESLWGQFDSQTRALSISRKLIQTQPWENVLGVLKHEMAHQLVFEENPENFYVKPHGEEFQKACRKIGVPEIFCHSRVGLQDFPLDWRNQDSNTAEIKIIEKVKKLLSLASSTNEYEAGLAMEKAQSLLAQHNLEQLSHWDRGHFVHLIINHGKKRQNSWEQRIISLLIEYFFVEIILLQQFDAKKGQKNQVFEIIGTKENVLMAEYVYYFLLNQLEFLVSQKPHLTRSEKASFRLGILEGFAEKLKGPVTPEVSVKQKALIQFEQNPKLRSYLKEIYPSLRSRKNYGRLIDPTAFATGKAEGQKLILNKPLAEKNTKLGFLSTLRRF